MAKRITAIVFIFVCASVAWGVLGGTIFSRTYDLNQVSGDRVASTWGTAHNQAPPKAFFEQVNTRDQESVENGKVIVRINPKFHRPAEVELLIGDATKAKEKLGWEPKTTLEQLCKMMVEEDLRRNKAGFSF